MCPLSTALSQTYLPLSAIAYCLPCVPQVSGSSRCPTCSSTGWSAPHLQPAQVCWLSGMSLIFFMTGESLTSIRLLWITGETLRVLCCCNEECRYWGNGKFKLGWGGHSLPILLTLAVNWFCLLCVVSVNSFVNHYQGRRTPFVIIITPDWLLEQYRMDGTRQFLQFIRAAFEVGIICASEQMS